MPAPSTVNTPPLPAWRVELNEKVRALKARRAGDSQADAAIEDTQIQFDSDLPDARIAPGLEARRPSRVPQEALETASASNRNTRFEAPAIPARRSSTNIVEAALTRVKRASENASRAALPKIEPARPLQSGAQVALAVDREATARALESVPDPEPQIESEPAPRPEPAATAITRPINAPTPSPEARGVETTNQSEIEVSVSVQEAPPPTEMPVIDELEPLDYLEAEIRKVDKSLGSQFLKNESPSLFTHAIIGIVDLLTVAASCSPFLAAISIADGSFLSSQTAVAAGLIVGLISFFYLALTHCVCGRTFGMMLTNTRVVDASTFQPLSGPRALLRSAGYFVAAAPAMLGFLWTATNRRHRGWPDIISHTVVVRDF